jgi:hypothetical protein
MCTTLPVVYYPTRCRQPLCSIWADPSSDQLAEVDAFPAVIQPRPGARKPVYELLRARQAPVEDTPDLIGIKVSVPRNVLPLRANVELGGVAD